MTFVGLGLTCGTRLSEADTQAGAGRGRGRPARSHQERCPLHHRSRPAPGAGRRKRFRPLLALLAAQFGDPHAPGVVPPPAPRRAHPPRHALPRRRDGRGRRCGAASPAPTPAGATRWPSSPATSSSPAPPTSWPTSGPEAVRIQAEAFERLVTGQILETAGPRDGRDPAALPRRAHRQDRLADRRLLPVRRAHVRRRRADVGVLTQYGERLGIAFQLADDALDIAPTATSPARPPAPTCARASRPCPSSCARRPRRPAQPDDLRAVRAARLRPQQ
ncbi:Geranylgeranyl pyrophosphate synthase OS=Streptomyces antimycoticus OX=68175 GN=SANT12839_054650 PE=3 SV=1 [Streptomyces antimycoticus]